MQVVNIHLTLMKKLDIKRLLSLLKTFFLLKVLEFAINWLRFVLGLLYLNLGMNNLNDRLSEK